MFNFFFQLFSSGVIADRVNLRYYLVIGMLGESVLALLYIALYLETPSVHFRGCAQPYPARNCLLCRNTSYCIFHYSADHWWSDAGRRC